MNEREKPEEIEGDKPAFSRFIVHKDEATLKKGDLVYAFVNSSSAVEFIAPVSVPRVAYDSSIAALLPDGALAACNNYEDMCPACRVFGWVHQHPDEETKQVAYAGRVRFSNATLEHSAGTLPPTPLAILSSPKPTTTRFYLMPRDGRISETWTGDHARKGYDRDINILRGRKFYRHHGSAREGEYRRAGDRLDDQNRTVRDALKPGARFEFRVYFENLAPVELGALLWALDLDEQGFHRLGFAKPLGFGSVAVKVKELRVLDAQSRYALLVDGGWKTADDRGARCIQVFKTALTNRYGSKSDAFESLPNVQDLLALLSKPTNELPIHYPRTSRLTDIEGKNFEWFMGNNRYVFCALGPANRDQGLPLITRDGTKVQ